MRWESSERAASDAEGLLRDGSFGCWRETEKAAVRDGVGVENREPGRQSTNEAARQHAETHESDLQRAEVRDLLGWSSSSNCIAVG